MSKKSRVLITGVAGFIGSNLADRLLKEGHPVIGIDNLSYGVLEQVPEGVEFYKLDIRSKKIYPLFKKIDFVFHLAAKNCISDCQNDPVETSDINVTGTVNVFEAAKRAGVKKVIYAESSAIYEGINKFPTPENKIKPESFYARSKIAGNLFAEGYKKFYGVTSVGLRYFSVYGPRQDYRRTMPPLPSAFIIKIMKGENPIIYGTGEKRRDYVHIDDINDFHLLCMDNVNVDNKIFNLGSGTNVSILDVYKIVSKALKSDLPSIFKEDMPGEALITLSDISEAKKIGWLPKISLEDGIQGLIEYIRGEFAKGNIK